MAGFLKLGNSTFTKKAGGGVFVANTVPAQASAVGYNTRTLNSTFQSSLVNLTDPNGGAARPSGKEWYLDSFFGIYTSAPSDVTINDGVSAVINPAAANYNAHLASVSDNGSGWVGTAYGGGGYFEARLKFDATLISTGVGGAANNGWPAWWMMSVEHMIGMLSDQWTGKAAGYKHFAEIDVMECIYPDESPPEYVGTTHDWFGNPEDDVVIPDNGSAGTGPARLTSEVPSFTSYNEFNTYGVLWVPATPGSDGYLKWYLNDVQIGTTQTWDYHATDTAIADPPVYGVGAMAILDFQHMPLILGSGVGVPMTVQWVRVWQADDSENLVQ